ncbi:hypothetical protein [Variovorax sp. 22077]|uniref:hypothetical protein n=1 Tax=Variovorax sp. 22077 TaxID=3453867 RepID=UPI003F82661B
MGAAICEVSGGAKKMSLRRTRNRRQEHAERIFNVVSGWRRTIRPHVEGLYLFSIGHEVHHSRAIFTGIHHDSIQPLVNFSFGIPERLQKAIQLSKRYSIPFQKSSLDQIIGYSSRTFFHVERRPPFTPMDTTLRIDPS